MGNTGSVLPALTAALVEAWEHRGALLQVEVTRSTRRPETSSETVHLGAVTAWDIQYPRAGGSGRTRDETGTLDWVVTIRSETVDDGSALDRAMEIVSDMGLAVASRNDRFGVEGLVYCRPSGIAVESDEDTGAAQITATLSLEVLGRITNP